MSRALIIHQAGPMVSVQDKGRPGWLGLGVAEGGAADVLALDEGAALLGQPASSAALEMGGMGGVFGATEPLRFALTGAPMRASLAGRALRWNISAVLEPGEKLEIGPCEAGHFGYLSVAGGFDEPEILGSRAAHLSVGFGRRPAAGDHLPVGPDPVKAPPAPQKLAVDDRCSGGEVRFLAGPQTALFPEEMLERFCETEFTRDLRGDRQGVKLAYEGGAFSTGGQLNIVSDAITPGDIQMTGEGRPYVLLSECQTTGGYPRIGAVIPADLPKIVQASAGKTLRFRLVTREEALAAAPPPARRAALLRDRLSPLVRNPAEMPDLLSYQLISGAITGWEDE